MELKKLIEIAERNDEYELRSYGFYDENHEFMPIDNSVDSFYNLGGEGNSILDKIIQRIFEYYNRRLTKLGLFKVRSPVCYKIFKCKRCNSIHYIGNLSDKFRYELKLAISKIARDLYDDYVIIRVGNEKSDVTTLRNILRLFNEDKISPHLLINHPNVNHHIFESFTPDDIAQIIDLDKPELKLINSDPIGVLKIRRQYPSEDMIYVMEAYKFYNDIET